GRSAHSYPSYPGAQRAVRHLQQHAGRLVRTTVIDPATGRWGWRVDLDDRAVAVSGRWYERDHDSRLGMDKFVNLVPDAARAAGVVTLHDRRRACNEPAETAGAGHEPAAAPARGQPRSVRPRVPRHRPRRRRDGSRPYDAGRPVPVVPGVGRAAKGRARLLHG